MYLFGKKFCDNRIIIVSFNKTGADPFQDRPPRPKFIYK